MPSTQIGRKPMNTAKKRYVKKHQHSCGFDFTETHIYYEKCFSTNLCRSTLTYIQQPMPELVIHCITNKANISSFSSDVLCFSLLFLKCFVCKFIKGGFAF